MKGNRDWVVKAQNKLAEIESSAPKEDISSAQPSAMKLALIQGKKLSQIICFIWSNKDPETAGKLDRIFKSGNENLKKLLFANSEEPSAEYNLLLKIFKAEDLPIFESADRELIEFEVVTNTFQGGSVNDPSVFEPLSQLIIPYPPCPTVFDDSEAAMSGYAPIKKSELKDWLNQSPNDSPFHPNNPYIPTTCS
jgi:hypothetical protein